jgi:Na+-transporting NADH:ubiquinone oxidoreductase subunit C
MIRKRAFSVFYMFLLTLFFSSVVSGVHRINEERIKSNEKTGLQRIILDVLAIDFSSDAPGEEIEELFQNRVKVESEDGKTVYVGFANDKESITGYAFPLGGPGFWGPIRGMIAVDPGLNRVIDIAFYEHTETPGLGGRITEPFFRDQFREKRLQPVKGKYFDFRPPGTARGENEVDAIAGATETSRRLEAFLNENLNDYIPWLEQRTGR